MGKKKGQLKDRIVSKLKEKIYKKHRAIEKANGNNAKHAYQIGSFLAKLKRHVKAGHGNWMDYVEKEFKNIHLRSIERYMQIYRSYNLSEIKKLYRIGHNRLIDLKKLSNGEGVGVIEYLDKNGIEIPDEADETGLIESISKIIELIRQKKGVKDSYNLDDDDDNDDNDVAGKFKTEKVKKSKPADEDNNDNDGEQDSDNNDDDDDDDNDDDGELDSDNNDNNDNNDDDVAVPTVSKLVKKIKRNSTKVYTDCNKLINFENVGKKGKKEVKNVISMLEKLLERLKEI